MVIQRSSSHLMNFGDNGGNFDINPPPFLIVATSVYYCCINHFEYKPFRLIN